MRELHERTQFSLDTAEPIHRASLLNFEHTETWMTTLRVFMEILQEEKCGFGLLMQWIARTFCCGCLRAFSHEVLLWLKPDRGKMLQEQLKQWLVS